MKKITGLIISITTIFSFAACSDSAREGTEKSAGGDSGTMISLRGEISGVAGYSRAIGQFPNGGTIAVTAALYQAGAIDWQSYDDIQNATATTDSISGNLYGFDWTTDKYWPLDNTQLVFMAYSPPYNTTAAMDQSMDVTRLYITLLDDMPDILVASSNLSAESTPLSKTDMTVNFGEFQHALSQLTVRVVADTSMNTAVTLDGLEITTTRKNARLDLLDGAEGLTIIGSEDFSYSPVTASKSFVSSPAEYTVLLYPGTQDDTSIRVTFGDGQYSFSRSLSFSDFENSDPSDPDPLQLTRAYNTILTITIKGISVQNPEDGVQLQGQLSDWKEMGSFDVTIN